LEKRQGEKRSTAVNISNPHAFFLRIGVSFDVQQNKKPTMLIRKNMAIILAPT